MKKAAVVVAALLALAGGAEWLILASATVDPWRLAAAMVCLSLVLGVFVAFTDEGFVSRLRALTARSPVLAVSMPTALLVPYLVLALGTGTFTWLGTGKLAAYILAPTVLLLPDRLRKPERMGWRDLAAMAALAVPVMANWLTGIWEWPRELYFFRPIYSVCVGAYAFTVLRGLDGVGYKLLWRWGDVKQGFINFVGFSIIAIPLGLGLSFLHPHLTRYPPASAKLFGHSFPAPGEAVFGANFIVTFAVIYLTIAIPEEFLFRGILQNFLVKSLPGKERGLFGLVIASVVFGASHLHHAPVPNWRYAILASIAGMFYGNAYRVRGRLSASALTHALVDSAWHFWF